MPGEARSIQAILAQLAQEGAEVGRIADLAAVTWRRIDAALAPIIGQRGVAALYKRSLYLARTEHAFLAPLPENASSPGDFSALHAALSDQTNANATAANAALLETFSGLLTSLIGASLTERLLRSVWDHSSSGSAAQDTSP